MGTPISSLPLASTPTGTEYVPIVQSATTKKTTVADIVATVSSSLLPPGVVAHFATASAPTGWLVANGAAVSRTTYAALFAVMGTAYGAGDGSTTFNLPDLRDRMAIGSGSSYALAATGGSKDAIVVSHSHSGTTNADGSHTHFISNTDNVGPNTSPSLSASNYLARGNGGGGTSEAYQLQGTATAPTVGITSTASTHTHTFATGSTGASGTNANLPPYVALLACVKY